MVVRSFFVALLLGVLLAFGITYHWLNKPFVLASPLLDLSIETGANANEVATAAVSAGVKTDARLLYWWFRLSGDARKIKAGSYELETGTTPISLLRKLVQGEEALRSVTLVEGWNFRQVRIALQKAEQLRPVTDGLSAEQIMAALGKPGVSPEGRFFPDTYAYAKGSGDLAILERAMRAMESRLAATWLQRHPTSPLQNPEQALVLASIVEKETGRANDRPEIAAVFTNRLRIGMRLQTDPTVIYGLGETFDGNLRKQDLQTDTPWNTYTRAGLPPTPIALPGKASLLAAVQPAESKALYFVARGDGTSQFSATLDEHNRAVNKYQRGQ